MGKAESEVLKLGYYLKYIFLVDKSLFDKVVEIASNNSPSSSFNKTVLLAKTSGIDNYLPLAKLTRWLAVIRRDSGNLEFSKIVKTLRDIVFFSDSENINKTDIDSYSVDQNLSIPEGTLPNQLIPGIYKYGKYNWLGEVRLDKISIAYKRVAGRELPKQFSTLALDIFHSLYLIDTTLSERVKVSPILQWISKFTKPIRESEIRSKFIQDEFSSIIMTANILARLVKSLEEVGKMSILENLLSQGSESDVSEDDKESICNAVRNSISDSMSNDNVEKITKTSKIIQSLSASKVGHTLEFDDKVRIHQILSQHQVMVSTILDAIDTTKKERGTKGGTIQFKGYKKLESYSELPKIRITELVYPEELYLKRIVLKESDVKKYEKGITGEKRKYVVVIDKSSSMGSNLDKSKGVALSLLVKSQTDDVRVMFFDSAPYDIVSLKDDFMGALERIAQVRPSGGTNIDKAIRKVDENLDGYTIVLITDGEDTVTYKPTRNKLISILIGGDNDSLRSISDKYFKLDTVTGKIIEMV